MATDTQLRPYGYAPGKCKKWCAGCGRIHPGLGAKAFKCRACASFDFRMAEQDCRNFGDLPANPVPPDLDPSILLSLPT